MVMSLIATYTHHSRWWIRFKPLHTTHLTS